MASGCIWPFPTSGSASWLYRFKLDKRSHDMGLGSLEQLTLAAARELADVARRKVRDGIDPIEERRRARLAASLNRAQTMTFRECALAYIQAHRAGWSNAEHSKQWPTSLERFAYPAIGDLPIDAIDLGLVLKVIEPIWSTKPETASRVRGRIESILDWATVRGYRTGENPARWRGHLESLLPAPAKAKRAARSANGRGEHHAALPYAPARKRQHGSLRLGQGRPTSRGR
jgi:hypothetical protein